jgi:hypothetical protein
MIDDFFQKTPSASSPSSKGKPTLLFRGLFYTSLAGFFSGLLFGYLYMRGWVPNAENGLILYAVTFGIGAVLSTSFVLYQSKLNQLKSGKIKNKSK